jgi:methyltransferase (TIGR00027 family)
MADPDRLVRNISDTALWAAVYRARESERPDALFDDPLARRLAGERGQKIAESMGPSNQQEWAWVTRTVLFDRLISEQVEQGADLVVNLAAGLDARPYRMALPATLRWVEVDLPELLDYKEKILKDEKPKCVLERVALDLSDVTARCDLFARLGYEARLAVVLSEGLLIYLSAEEVGLLARDLAAPPGFRRWIVDLASPGLRDMLQKRIGTQLGHGGAVLRFAPVEGPWFSQARGWRPAAVHSFLKTAARLKRLTPWMRLLALLPESKDRQGKRPWAAVCLLERV